MKFSMENQMRIGILTKQNSLILLYILSTRVLKYTVADFFSNGYQLLAIKKYPGI